MIRMVPFIYSSEIAYEIEFGNVYARLFYDKAVVVDGVGNEVVIATPYLEADIAALHIDQIADTMWITHGSYPPYKLTRTSVTAISITKVTFTDGPFRVRNDILNDDDVTMTYAGTTTVDATGTLTASAATFVEGNVGALWSLNYPRDDTIVSLAGTDDTSATPLDVEGIFRVVTKNRWTGTVELFRQVNGTGYEVFRTWKSTLDYNVSYTKTEYEKDVQYYIKAVITAGTFGADMTVNETTQTGVVKINSIVSSTVANVVVMEKLPVTNGLVATKRWAEGAWSPLRGYPTSVTFLQERCIYSGPDNLYLSETGDYENFEEGTKDADSFILPIPTTNTMRWVKALNDAIVLGTSGDEWTVSSNKLGTPITPTNYIIESQTTYGSSTIQPIVSNNVILFVDYVGRKVREFTLSEAARYVAPDMTELAEHITESGITSIAFQKNPEEIMWSTLTDGSLLTMTYGRANNIVAWAKHPTTGEVESVSVIPQDDEDQIWITVTRDVSGVDIVLIEVFESRTFDDIEDCHFVDSGVFYDDVDATVITVGDHLIGKTVHILADGEVVTPQVVSAAGTITLTTTAGKVHAGLQFTPKLEPMRPDIPTRSGTTHSSLVGTPEMGISFLNTMNATYGVTDDDQFDINYVDARWQNNTEIDDLFTGDVVVAVDGGFSLDNNLIISSDDPLPVTVRALIPKIEKTGR